MSADLLAEFDSFYQTAPHVSGGQAPVASSPHNTNWTASAHWFGEGTVTSVDRLTGLPQLHVSNNPQLGESEVLYEQRHDPKKGTELAWVDDKDGWNTVKETNVSDKATGRMSTPRTDPRSKQSPPLQQQQQDSGRNRTTNQHQPPVEWHHNHGGHHAGGQGVQQKQTHPAQLSRRPPRDEHVLFDAEDDQEDDDFGDFESGQDTTGVTPRNQDVSPLAFKGTSGTLLDFDGSSDLTTHRSMDTGPHMSQSLVSSQAAIQVAPPATEWWSDAQENLAPSVSDSVANQTKISYSSAARKVSITAPSLRFDAFPTLDNSSSSSGSLPTNIPPPALLLNLFPTIFETAQQQLLEPLTQHANTSHTKAAIMNHPETQTFLASYLAMACVLSRIIAGRKLRWKRDTLLAQSMRIGPASASGRSGGMKLAGVDKSETSKEEREVSDVLRIWRQQLGKLRSAVALADSDMRVPDITDNPAVRTAKEDEGAITAPKPCALCGLKRNERVFKIDVDVQDSFGEWWVEHWGHRSCKSFWEVQRSNLAGR